MQYPVGTRVKIKSDIPSIGGLVGSVEELTGKGYTIRLHNSSYRIHNVPYYDLDTFVLSEDKQRIVELEQGLAEAIEELEAWWRDQGNYGTTGYDEMIPRLKSLIKSEEK